MSPHVSHVLYSSHYLYSWIVSGKSEEQSDEVLSSTEWLFVQLSGGRETPTYCERGEGGRGGWGEGERDEGEVGLEKIVFLVLITRNRAMATSHTQQIWCSYGNSDIFCLHYTAMTCLSPVCN